jgi:hypothetical protein
MSGTKKGVLPRGWELFLACAMLATESRVTRMTKTLNIFDFIVSPLLWNDKKFSG